MTSPCREVNILARLLAKDIMTTTARNMRMIDKETGGSTWAAPGGQREPTVPRVDAWRIPYLGRLLEERDILVHQGEEFSEEVERVQELIDSICSN